MENKAPFENGQKIIRITDSTELKKGNVYTVKTQRLCGCGQWRLSVDECNEILPDYRCNSCPHTGHDGNIFMAKNFAPVNPYSNSAIKELAEEAVKERLEIDCPLREVVNN